MVTVKAKVTATAEASAMDAAMVSAAATAKALQVHIHPTNCQQPSAENDVRLAIADTKIRTGKCQQHGSYGGRADIQSINTLIHSSNAIISSSAIYVVSVQPYIYSSSSTVPI